MDSVSQTDAVIAPCIQYNVYNIKRPSYYQRYGGMQGPTCICGDSLVKGFLLQPDLNCNANCSGFAGPALMGQRYCGGVGGQVSVFSFLRK